MKPLDVIASVDFGYRLVWAERAYLVRLGAVPVAVKLLSVALIMAIGWPQESLRNTVLMLPSMFAYGWMFSHLVRLVFYRQYWPFRPSGDPVADGIMLQDRARGITSGTLFFVVIAYLLSGLNAILAAMLTGMKMQMAGGQVTEETNGMAGLAALGFLILFLWSIRFLFLFIPAAAGVSVRPIVKAPQGMLLSLQMGGIGLVCCVPVMLIAWWGLAAMIPDSIRTQGISAGMGAGLTIWLVLASVLAQMIATAAVAFGIKTMMEQSK